MKRLAEWLRRAGLALAILAAAGCATVPDDGDLPWNTPKTWEAAPSIPGLSDYR